MILNNPDQSGLITIPCSESQKICFDFFGASVYFFLPIKEKEIMENHRGE
jgi:hypothetical protein